MKEFQIQNFIFKLNFEFYILKVDEVKLEMQVYADAGLSF